MCEYCEGGKPIRERLKHKVIGAVRFVRIKRNKWGYCLSVSTLLRNNGKDQSYIRINACPMCGRKFREREMAHVGNNVYKCRECFLGGEKWKEN